MRTSFKTRFLLLLPGESSRDLAGTCGRERRRVFLVSHIFQEYSRLFFAVLAAVGLPIASRRRGIVPHGRRFGGPTARINV